MPWPKGPQTCKQCSEGFENVQQLAVHSRREHPRAKRPDDTSNVSVSAPATATTEPGEVHDEPPPQPVIKKPKIAGGLVPWISLLGLGVYSRNAYDGSVIQQGTPAFIEALDEVAQENETVYKFLAAIALADSPTAKLIIASLAIMVPILANHRPDSKALRTVTGGLRFMPGTNIPRLPVVTEDEEERAQAEAVDDFVDAARTTLEGLSEEDQQKIATAMQGVPEDVMAKMMASAPIFAGGMAHPEAETPDADTG
jgi:hypothetical protein